MDGWRRWGCEGREGWEEREQRWEKINIVFMQRHFEMLSRWIHVLDAVQPKWIVGFSHFDGGMRARCNARGGHCQSSRPWNSSSVNQTQTSSLQQLFVQTAQMRKKKFNCIQISNGMRAQRSCFANVKYIVMHFKLDLYCLPNWYFFFHLLFK